MRRLTLTPNDAERVNRWLVDTLRLIAESEGSVAVRKRMASLMTRQRNLGRPLAKKRHPFTGVCEMSGQPLDARHAHMDEIVPELGYADGNVRWLCPAANGSGRFSCGGPHVGVLKAGTFERELES